MKLGLFPSLFDHPTKIRFVEQETDEVIELLLRQHWVTNVPWIFFSLIAFILPAILLQLDQGLGINFSQSIPLNILIEGLVIWYLLILAFVIEKFLHWYFNVYIVTNIHLIDINFETLLNRSIVEAGLENVESASSRISGIIRSLFRYGDVIVQTAAESQQITFDAVPNPDFVTDRINDLRRHIPPRRHQV